MVIVCIIISDNFELIKVENITNINGVDTNFMYSDNNSVNMCFKLV